MKTSTFTLIKKKKEKKLSKSKFKKILNASALFVIIQWIEKYRNWAWAQANWPNDLCTLQRHRSNQSDQSLSYLHRSLAIFTVHTKHGCAGWSESSLGMSFVVFFVLWLNSKEGVWFILHYFFTEFPVFNPNSVDHDQMPHFATSDLGLRCLPRSL